MARVSIIIPCYNQARFLTTTLESALAQTHRDCEIIAVNDGSTDATPAILSAYAGRVRVIHQHNSGLAAARNAGFRAATGELLLFLDSDDVIEPTMIARLHAVLLADPALGLVYCGWKQIDERGQVLGEAHPGIAGQVLEPLLLRQFFFFASGTLIRRSSLAQVGPFNPALRWSEDADLWQRMALAGLPFGYCDAPLLRYRIHTRSMTASVDAAQVQGWQTALDLVFGAPELPERIRALEPRARAMLHLETAGRYARLGRWLEATDHVRQALYHEPRPDVRVLADWLSGTARDPRTPDPAAFLKRMMVLFPRCPTLRRCVLASYHASSAFAAYQRGESSAARPHIIPALRAAPALLCNRGFVRVALASIGVMAAPR